MKDIIRKLKERKFITKVGVSEDNYKDDITQTGDPDEIIKYVESKYEPERPEYPITKESNPTLMKIIAHWHWLADSPDFMTWDEAEAVTAEDFLFTRQGGNNDPAAFPSSVQSVLHGYERLATGDPSIAPYNFDEFKYFTKITSIPSLAGAHIKTITLPPTTTEIKYKMKNSDLESITILSKTAPTIPSDAFNSGVTIKVPKDATGYDVAPWTNYTIERLEE